MTDITERLRLAAPKTFPMGALCNEAADEIESLRAQLAEARADHLMVTELYNAAVSDYNESRALALNEAAIFIERVNGSIPNRQELAAAIRALKQSPHAGGEPVDIEDNG